MIKWQVYPSTKMYILRWTLVSNITYFIFVSLLITRAPSISLIAKAHSSSSPNSFPISPSQTQTISLYLVTARYIPQTLVRQFVYSIVLLDATYLNKPSLEPCTQNLFLQIYVQVYVQNLICVRFISWKVWLAFVRVSKSPFANLCSSLCCFYCIC